VGADQSGGRKYVGFETGGRMLEEKMRQADEYWAAFERLKRIKPIPGFDASKRMTREQAHERR